MTRSENMELAEVLERLLDRVAALDAAIAALSAQQPAADGGFTAADMMDARQEGRKEAQRIGLPRERGQQ